MEGLYSDQIQTGIAERGERMRLEPNETAWIKHELFNRRIEVWNRTRKAITVYYTARGVEVHG